MRFHFQVLIGFLALIVPFTSVSADPLHPQTISSPDLSVSPKELAAIINDVAGVVAVAVGCTAATIGGCTCNGTTCSSKVINSKPILREAECKEGVKTVTCTDSLVMNSISCKCS